VGVFLSYVRAKGHTLIDRDLYLPVQWCEDRERCRSAGIPETVRFHTKPELARANDRANRAGRCCRLMGGSRYGVRRQGSPCAPGSKIKGIPTCWRWPVMSRSDFKLLMGASESRSAKLKRSCLSLTTGTGSAWAKEPRDPDSDASGSCSQLAPLGRRWAPFPAHPSQPHRSRGQTVLPGRGLHQGPACSRWCWSAERGGGLSRTRETAKDMGLDHYQVRSVTAWYRHVTLVLLAQAYLSEICIRSEAASTPPVGTLLDREPLHLTLPEVEVRHLLGHLIWPASSNVRGVLAWSWWRRCHHRCACCYHSKRRRETG
jgi:hypothetical protein